MRSLLSVIVVLLIAVCCQALCCQVSSAQDDTVKVSDSVLTSGDMLFLDEVKLIKNGERCIVVQSEQIAFTAGDEYVLDWEEFVPEAQKSWCDKGPVSIGGWYKDGGTIKVHVVCLAGQLNHREFEMICHANKYRRSHGLRDLLPDFDLMRTAREQSRIMIQRGMNHGYTSGWSGENIAVGQGGPSEVTTTWYHSSGHRANMLNSGFRWIGVGGGGSLGRHWTQQFR